MNFIKYIEPWTNWNNTQINGGAIDIMLTENGREASVGQFSISGFNFDNLDVGEYVSLVGSPHIWAIDAAEYDSDADETTYTIIDAFCHTLKNRLLGFDLYTNQRLINNRIGVILDAVAESYPGLDGWSLYTALRDASKLIDPRTNLAETSRAGDSVLDVIYSVIEVTNICLWITTRILNATTLQAILCYRMSEDPITAPKNTTIKRAFRAKGERMFIVEGRTLDYSINDTGVVPDTHGTGPAVENFSGITQTLDAVTGERAKIYVGGPDNWTRAALTLTPSAVGSMVSFNGSMPTPLFAVYRRRIWMRCNVKWTGLAGAPTPFPGIKGNNAVIVPYMDPAIADLLKRNDIYYNGYDCYIGWMSANILVTDVPNVTIAFKQSCNINTDLNTPITTDFGNFVLSDFSSKVFGAGRKAGCAVIGLTTGSLSANDKCWIPLTGSADPTLGLDFHQLNPSDADDLKILSAPMAYPLDLWRVPYASLMSTEKAIREEAVNTTATIDLDSDGFNVDNLGDKNGGLWIGSLIRSTFGDLFRVTAITTSYNDDGTPKYDIETMPGTL